MTVRTMRTRIRTCLQNKSGVLIERSLFFKQEQFPNLCRFGVPSSAWITTVTPKNAARAVRYRELALAEPDRSKADMLLKLADEADRDVLCTADWLFEKWQGKAAKPVNGK